MRILFILRKSSAPRRKKLVEAMEERGCQVVVEMLTLRVLRLRWLWVGLIFFNALLLYGAKARRYLRRVYFYYFAYSRACQAIADRHENIDVVLMNGVNYLNYFRKRESAVSYALITDHVNLLSKEHSPGEIDIPQFWVHASWNRIERKILDNQDRIFVLSNYVRNAIVEKYGISPTRVIVVGGGANHNIDIEKDAETKQYSGHNVLFVGYDGKRKGLDTVRKAIQRLNSVIPDICLHVVGVDGVSERNTVYYGKLDCRLLKNLYYRSQIFAMPAYREPFGVVFIEAMMAKNACIGTSRGAMPEIISDGETGYIIEPGDVVALSDAIQALFSDRTLLRSMGEKGYVKAKNTYGWNRSADRMLEVLSYRDTMHK